MGQQATAIIFTTDTDTDTDTVTVTVSGRLQSV